MAIEFRKTGIRVVGDAPWGTHFCLFYETKQDLLDTVVPYFKAGLESKEFCLWVVSNSELITVEEAKGALAQAVPDLDRHLSDQNIEILNALDWYLEENEFSLERVMSAWDAKLNRALALGYDGMRVSGDTFWLRDKEWKDFCTYEKEVNDSITARPMTVLCTYPLAHSGAAEILDVVQVHQYAIARRHGEWKVIQAPEQIQANAEIERLDEELQRVIEGTPEPHLLLRYGVAVLSVSAALIFARMLDIHLVTAPVSLFLCALMLSAWYGGIMPGLLAMALSLLAFDYYFVAPIYSLTVEVKEIPRFLIFALSSLFVVSLSAPQRSAAKSLRRARDVLDGAVRELKRTNETLHAKIAERKHAEALLHVKEQEFRAIVENAPDQIIRYDREFRRTYVNPAVANAYGLPAEDLIGKPFGSVIQDARLDANEDELAQIRQRIAAVFDTGKSYEYEITWPMPAGLRYYNVALFPELDLNGSVVNVLAISRDITERRQADHSLRLFRTLIDRSTDAIEVIDPVTLRFLDCNKSAYEDLGYSREEFLSLSIYDIDPLVDERMSARLIEEVDRSGFVLFESVHQRKDGSTFPVEVNLKTVRLERDYRLAMVRDITERKLAEEKLKRSESQFAEAQRLAHVGSWYWDLRSNAVTWSDELYRIFGLQPGEIDVAHEAMSFIHPEDRDLVRSIVTSSVKNKEPCSFYYRVLRPDGEQRILHSRGSIASDENGDPIRVFGATQDVTELKRAEETLKATSEQLRALSARLRSAREEEAARIGREIHDELGAALSSLRWDLEDVDETISESRNGSEVQDLRQKIEVMMKLTDSTINTVRRIASELRPIALDALGLTEAIEWQARQFQDRTGIIVDCEGTLENVDLRQEQSTAVFRIFQEALTNILRHAQATIVDIQMKEEEENGEFILTISDNGRGITDDEQSGRYTLGLLGMRERAHLIGGKIEITGSTGKGTVVTVRIPMPGGLEYPEVSH